MPRIITVGAAQLGPIARGETRAQVVDRMQPVDDGAPELWEYVRTLMDDAVRKEFLAP